MEKSSFYTLSAAQKLVFSMKYRVTACVNRSGKSQKIWHIVPAKRMPFLSPYVFLGSAWLIKKFSAEMKPEDSSPPSQMPLAYHTSRSYVCPHLLRHYPAILEILKVNIYYYILLFKSSDLSQTLKRKIFLPFKKDVVMRCTPAATGSFLKKWEITDILTVIYSGLSNKAW